MPTLKFNQCESMKMARSLFYLIPMRAKNEHIFRSVFFQTSRLWAGRDPTTKKLDATLNTNRQKTTSIASIATTKGKGKRRSAVHTHLLWRAKLLHSVSVRPTAEEFPSLLHFSSSSSSRGNRMSSPPQSNSPISPSHWSGLRSMVTLVVI